MVPLHEFKQIVEEVNMMTVTVLRLSFTAANYQKRKTKVESVQPT